MPSKFYLCKVLFEDIENGFGNVCATARVEAFLPDDVVQKEGDFNGPTLVFPAEVTKGEYDDFKDGCYF
ncbi:MAG: hypothetical protein CVV47_06960 [Spirochaetae bacterium HGW-Spirochaetae-3]|jgi:hypothetical protein|nr:MAG: hypothetical protein CVV47_06960 [Spirochaetae bacterium HGW-Spirochaetae-3]